MAGFSKWTYRCIALLVMTVSFCACDKTQDVDYFGQWELKVAYVTNEHDPSRQDTIKAERRYMCIQGEIVYLMASGDGYGHYTQRMEPSVTVNTQQTSSVSITTKTSA